MTPKVILVLPAYNEAFRLPTYLDYLLPALACYNKAEINVLVVDDGSAPEHRTLLQADLEHRKKDHPFLQPLFELPKNLGKGGAILAGWKSAPHADYYAFLDADGAISPFETLRLLERALEKNASISIFASRVKMLGKQLERSTQRHYAGRLFAFCVGALINSHVYDSQCGYKIVPASHLKSILPYLEGHRFAFDVELLAALSAQNFAIEEVPIDWKDIQGSKISLFRDSFKMLLSITTLHRKKKHGYYGKKSDARA